MGDIENPKLLWAKGLLFAALGTMAGAMLLMEAPNVTVAILLLITVWAFCRAYYFAFYVIEHYVDSTYRFAGLWDFFRYAIGSRRAP